MAGGLLDDEDEITGINITPLVDVVLVLLIIFMVTANFIVSQSIPIQLPQATAQPPLAKKSLTFALDRDARLYFGGNEIAFENIPQIIAEQGQAGVDLQALIAADKDVPHGQVVKLIDLIRKGGVQDFAINVEQAQ